MVKRLVESPAKIVKLILLNCLISKEHSALLKTMLLLSRFELVHFLALYTLEFTFSDCISESLEDNNSHVDR